MAFACFGTSITCFQSSCCVVFLLVGDSRPAWAFAGCWAFLWLLIRSKKRDLLSGCKKRNLFAAASVCELITTLPSSRAARRFGVAFAQLKSCSCVSVVLDDADSFLRLAAVVVLVLVADGLRRSICCRFVHFAGFVNLGCEIN